MPFYQSRDMMLHYEVVGSGPTILMITALPIMVWSGRTKLLT